MKTLYTLITLLIIFTSCTKDSTNDVTTSNTIPTRTLNVNGGMVKDSNYILITDTKYVEVTSATVVVNTDTFYYVGNGYYKPNKNVIPVTTVNGIRYDLTIKYNSNNFNGSFINPIFSSTF